MTDIITSVDNLPLDSKNMYSVNHGSGMSVSYNISIIQLGVKHNNLITRYSQAKRRARASIERLGKKHKHSLGMAIKIGQTGKVIDQFKEIASFEIDHYGGIPTISIYEDDVYEELFAKVEKKISSIEKDCTWSELL